MKLKLNLVILLILSISCAKIKIKNTEWCGDLGIDGASCFNTHNDNSRDLRKEEWDKVRFGMICASSKDFSEWKSYIYQLCLQAGNRCTYGHKEKIINFFDKVEKYNDSIYYNIDDLK